MTEEKEYQALSGWLMLAVTLAVLAATIYLFVLGSRAAASPVPAIILLLVFSLLAGGFFIVEPNGSKVLLLFGSYSGTVKSSGFWWANPFFIKRSVSLRARTLNGEKLKVNDLAGNPVEIAAVVVWRVRDTYRASFEVDNYEQYVHTQSESAVRHLASSYPYDAEDETVSLRRNAEEVSQDLQKELQERLALAGVEVMEARLTHLAYAQEIAGAMLRRQQAAAIIAARQKIVDGAVGMVEMALDKLEKYEKLHLDEERKAAMVSNLLVVLCSEHAAQPVLNTGTLYQ
ncbi:MAG: membrane protein [Armatimonadota bacterium]|nr:MAG: membrane protein [Armatimonadota bacterium]